MPRHAWRAAVRLKTRGRTLERRVVGGSLRQAIPVGARQRPRPADAVLVHDVPDEAGHRDAALAVLGDRVRSRAWIGVKVSQLVSGESARRCALVWVWVWRGARASSQRGAASRWSPRWSAPRTRPRPGSAGPSSPEQRVGARVSRPGGRCTTVQSAAVCGSSPRRGSATWRGP